MVKRYAIILAILISLSSLGISYEVTSVYNTWKPNSTPDGTSGLSITLDELWCLEYLIITRNNCKKSKHVNCRWLLETNKRYNLLMAKLLE